jgi:hypothetical protein
MFPPDPNGPNGSISPNPPMPYNSNTYTDSSNNTPGIYVGTINGVAASGVSAATISITTNSEVDPFTTGYSNVSYNSVIFFYNSTTQVPGSYQGYNPGSHTTTITPNSLISNGATNAAIGTPLYILYYSGLVYTNSTGPPPVSYTLPSQFNPGVGSSANPGGLQMGYIFTILPCNEPTNLSQTGYLNNQILLSWSAPTDNGGGAITNYIVQYNTTGYAPWVQVNTLSSSTNYTVPELTNGTRYYFQVAAVNGYCNNGGPTSGPFSTTFSGISATTPDAPNNLTALSGLQSVSLTWDAPLNNGGTPIISYIVQYRVHGTPTWTTASSSISGATPYYVVSSLSDGTSYDFQVSATNTAGTGPYSAIVSATTLALPDAPTNLTAVPGLQSVSLTWDAPLNNGGTPITSYSVQYRISGMTPPSPWIPTPPISVSGATPYYVVSSLSDGTSYDFQVSATNTAGTGPYSAIVSATTFALPDAPTNLVATPGLQSMSLTWNAPLNNGGTPIISYIVQYRVHGTPTWTTASSSISGATPYYVVSGLQNATLYDFRVAAVNAVGQGPYSAIVMAETPTASSIGLTAEPGFQSVSLIWTTLSDDGVVSYTVRYRLHGTTPTSPWLPATTLPSPILPSTTPIHVIVTGLSNATIYDFEVAAVSAVGTGPYSFITCSTDMVPSAPTNLSGVPGTLQVSLTWSAPISDGGSPVVDYLIEYKLDSSGTWSTFSHVPSVATNQIVTGLNGNSLYDFRVSAQNIVGYSVPSNIFETTPFGAANVQYNKCGIKGYVPPPPPWSRAGGNNCPNCYSNYGYAACGAKGQPYSTYELDQRRKAEILKYKINGAQLSPSLFYSMISRNAFTRKKSWATQTQTYTNPNVNSLPEIKNASDETVALQCNNPPVLCSLTSDSDVPGPVIPLCIDENVPLYNYKMQVTNSFGGKYPVGLPPQ